jgi:hypothetical protein
MIGIEVEMSTPGIAAQLSGLAGQLPFAASVALNNLADDAQMAIRQTLPQHFTLRRPDFIDRTIYIANADRAKKDHLAVTLRVDPRRNFLAKFETGGEKTGQGGKMLAVPIIRASDKTLLITRGNPLALKKIMADIDQKKGRFRTPRRKGDPKPLLRQSQSVYLVKSAKGTFVIQRTGATTRVLYAFERQVPIQPELHFVDTARVAVIANADRRFEEAVAYAIATMR